MTTGGGGFLFFPKVLPLIGFHLSRLCLVVRFVKTGMMFCLVVFVEGIC
jgi:hypothetical protein